MRRQRGNRRDTGPLWHPKDEDEARTEAETKTETKTDANTKSTTADKPRAALACVAIAALLLLAIPALASPAVRDAFGGLLGGITGVLSSPQAPSRAESRSYEISQATYGVSDSSKVVYRADADLTVTIGDKSSSVTAQQEFSVPASATAFTVTATAGELSVSFVRLVDVAGSRLVSYLMSDGTIALGEGTPPDGGFIIGQPIPSQRLSKEWRDGGIDEDDKGILPSELTIEWSSDGGATWAPLDQEAAALLGYGSVPSLGDKSALSTYSEWVFLMEDTLHAYAMIDGEVTEISYRLGEPDLSGTYASWYEDGDVLVNVLKVPWSATLQWQDANNRYLTRKDAADVLATMTLHRESILGGTDDVVEIVLDDETAEGYVAIQDDGQGHWSLSLPNALGFDMDDCMYSYYLVAADSDTVQEGAQVDESTRYAPKYRNEDNWATIEDSLMDGGTLYMTLTGWTDFTGTKEWHDAGTPEVISQRPRSSLSLYRYRQDGIANYQTASPVPMSGADGIAVATETDTVRISYPQDEATRLPLYDADGYMYAYYAKETLTYLPLGNDDLEAARTIYRMEFEDNGDEPGNDRFLFNGGTIKNIQSNDQGIAVTKSWVSAARQELDGIVTLDVMRTDSLGEQSLAQTVSLSDFSAEIPSRTAHFTTEMYDTEGECYSFSVSERGVRTKVNGTMTDATIIEEGGVTYVITADGRRYRQEIEQSTADDGTIEFHVTNTLVGNAQVRIEKSFPQGLLDSPTEITYTIYRDDVAVGSVSKTYTTAEWGTEAFTHTFDVTKPSDLDTLTGVVDANLPAFPRYDATGREYTYLATETSVAPDIYSQSTFDYRSEESYATPTEGTDICEKYSRCHATIINGGTGSSIDLRVYKEWKDGGEQIGHLPVHVAAQVWNYDNDQWETIATETIGADSTFAYLTIPSEHVATYQEWKDDGYPTDESKTDMRIVETALGDYEVEEDSYALRQAHREHERNMSFVSTPNQNYDVSPAAEWRPDVDALGEAFVLTNKRVGVVRINIIKHWLDGANRLYSRPDGLDFLIKSTHPVFYSGASEATMSLTPFSQESPSTWAYQTGWLTKYDDEGELAEYTVTELDDWYYDAGHTDMRGQYQHLTDLDSSSYVLGSHGTEDEYTFEFTNRLADTVRPVMNKYWADEGNDEALAARPDIYPILYRTYTDADNETHVERLGYQDRDWKTYVESANWWRCVFEPEDRFTRDGYEYTYYVGEGIQETATGDYALTGAYADMPSGGRYSEFDDAGAVQKPTVTLEYEGETVFAAPFDNKTGLGGTLVNRRSATRTISGRKLWANLPDGLSKGYLPDVTFRLYRFGYDYIQGGGDQADLSHAEMVLSQDGTTPLDAILPSKSSMFVFSEEVERYDHWGCPYTYVVAEVAPNEITLAYDLTNELGGSITSTNAYRNDQDYSISISKDWTEMPSGLSESDYPSVTLTLVRYMCDANGQPMISSRSSRFLNEEGQPVDATRVIAPGHDTATWEDLAYYAPNARPYAYFVEEQGINGYQVHYFDPATHSLVDAPNIDGSFSVPVSDGGDQGTGAAELQNEYGDPGSIRIRKEFGSGWGSYNSASTPTSVELVISRTEISGSDEPQQVCTVTLGAHSSTVRMATGIDDSVITRSSDVAWEAEVSGLEVWSPHGKRYSYAVSETCLHYANGSTVPVDSDCMYTVKVGDPVGATATGTPNTVTIRNTPVATQLEILKRTQPEGPGEAALSSDEMLFATDLEAVPVTVQYHVRWSIDDGQSWRLLCDGEGRAKTWSVTSQGGEYPKVTISDLPAKGLDDEGQPHDIAYEAYEHAISYTGVTYESDADETTPAGLAAATSSTVGTCETTSTTEDGTSTVTNSMPMREIAITKVWEDQCDRDRIRPGSITVNVKRTGIYEHDDTRTVAVTMTSDDALPDDANRWQVSVKVPVYWNVNETYESSYSVTEDASTVPAKYDMHLASTDGTAWEVTAPGEDWTSADGASGAFIKNVQATEEQIALSAGKTWSIQGQSYPRSETPGIPEWARPYLSLNDSKLSFTLQYKEGDGDWRNIGSDPANDEFAQQTATHEATIDPATGGITCAAWENLPRHRYTGNLSAHVTYSYRIAETLTTAQSAVWEQGTPSSVEADDVEPGASGTLSITNALSTSATSVSKAWEDADNAYGTRPDAVRWILEKSADSGDTWGPVPAAWLENATSTSDADDKLTGTDEQQYAVTVSQLPAYATDGTTQMLYRFAEGKMVFGNDEVVPGDTTLYTPYDSEYVHDFDDPRDTSTEATNTMRMESLSVAKTWDDDDDAFGMRPSSITFSLDISQDEGATWEPMTYPGGGPVTVTATVNGDGTLSGGVVRDLPASDPSGDIPYSYRARETSMSWADGTVASRDGDRIGCYEVTSEETTGNSTLKNYYTTAGNKLVTTSIEVSKTWNDDRDRDGVRPQSLVIGLDADEDIDNLAEGATLSPGNSWSDDATWATVPVYKRSGDAITYELSETSDAEALGEYALTASAGTVDADGKSVSFQATEGAAATIALTNERQPRELTLRAHKAWDDGPWSNVSRPGTVTYELQATTTPDDAGSWRNAATVIDALPTDDATVTVDADDAIDGKAFSAEWTGLPVCLPNGDATTPNQGLVVHYRVVETKVGNILADSAHHSVSYSTQDMAGSVGAPTGQGDNLVASTVTNTPDQTSLRVTKSWGDDTESIADDVSSATFRVMASNDGWESWDWLHDDDGAFAELTIARQGPGEEEDGIEGLPAYDASGKALSYRAVEWSIATGESNPSASYDDPSTGTGTVGGFDVTTDFSGNTASGWETEVTNTPQTTGVTVTKEWDDGGWSGRPQSATFHLTRNGTRLGASYDKTVRSSDSAATLTWEGLPLTDATGTQSWSYEPVEETPAGYWDDVSQNTHTNRLVRLSVHKTDTSGTGLSGTRFSLSGELANGTSVAIVATTDGNASFDGVMAVGKEYLLAETAPTAGFVARPLDESYPDARLTQDGKMKLRASSDGAVSYETTSDGWKGLADNTLAIEDPPTHAKFSKVDQYGDAAQGATLTISGELADGSDSMDILNGEPVDELIGVLKAGKTYQVTESETPARYMPASFALVVGDDGSLSIRDATAPSGCDARIESDGVTVTVTDRLALADAEIRKLDDEGLPLQGCAFSLFKDDGTQDGLAIIGQVEPEYANGTASWSTGDATGATNPDTGHPLSDGLAAGHYWWKEVSCPSEWLLDETRHEFDVTVEQDGKTVTTTVSNARLDAKLVVNKVDDVSGAPIPDTAFKLERQATGDSWEEVGTLVTDDSGRATWRGLTRGGYRISEIAANANYANTGFSAGFDVTDGCHGKVLTMGTDALGGEQHDLFGMTVSEGEDMLRPDAVANRRILGTVTVAKSDEEGRPLPGATFALVDADGKEACRATTKEDGIATLPGIQWGEYLLRETDAPDGYATDTEERAVSIGYGNLTESFTADGRGIIANALTELTFEKEDDDGVPLDGCSFLLSPVTEGDRFADGTRDAKCISGESTTLRGLLVGGCSYDLTEVVAAPGYALADPIRIEVRKDGTMGLAEGEAGDAHVDEGGTTVTVTDRQISASLVKTDAKGQPLAGATVAIVGVLADGDGDGKATSLQVVTTGGACELDGRLVAGEDYDVIELVAPSGYGLPPAQGKIAVSRGGEVSVTDDMGGLLTAEGSEIRLVNEGKPLTKTGLATALLQTGETLAGIAAVTGMAGTGFALAWHRRDKRG